jgi:small subunit ribosomal protein S4e
MVKNHLKRVASPNTWNILRKEHVFITKPSPGAHSYMQATSLNTLLKEILGKANTTKEVKRILKEQEALVNGKRRYNEKYNVGFMDVVTFAKIGEHYRLSLDHKGKITAIVADHADTKLVRIVGKIIVTGGKTQLQTNDGRTIIVTKGDYTIGDSLLIGLPSQEIKEHFLLKEGSAVMVYKGKFAGTEGTIEKIDNDSVVIKTKNASIHTKKSYAFVTGEKKPSIKCSP